MAVSGAVAGAAAGFGFALVHGLMISDIWFSLPMLLIAGALCGLCLGWTYGLLFPTPDLAGWLKYNGLYLGMFALIAVASELLYEPVITLGELMAGGPAPVHLFARTLPLVVVSTFGMAAIIYRLYGRSGEQFVAILIACSVLALLLGLNISLMGLVFVPASSYYVIAETFGLILALDLVYAGVFAGLEWKRLSGRRVVSTGRDPDHREVGRPFRE
jgi:hypothetical protein